MMEDKGNQMLSVEELIDKYIGKGGKWQRIQIGLVWLQNMAFGTCYLLYLLVAFTPPHRCVIPQCEAKGNTTFDQPFVDFALPDNQGLRNGDDVGKTGRSQCFGYVQDTGFECKSNNFGKRLSLGPCQEFVYDRTTFTETLTTEYDLVCDKSYLPKLLGTLYMVGILIGNIVGGFITDKFGRAFNCKIMLSVIGPLSILAGFAQGFVMYGVVHTLILVATSALWISSASHLYELSNKNNRNLNYGIAVTIWCLSVLIMVAVAVFEKNWRMLHIWLGLIVCCLAPVFIFGQKESIRWLIIAGKESRAESILSSAMVVNGRPISEDDRIVMRRDINLISVHAKRMKEVEKTLSTSPLDLFRKKYQKRTLILFILWFASVLGIYGLLMAVGSLAGNLLVNFTLSTLADVPSGILMAALADRVGCRRLLQVAALGMGVTCCAMAFLPDSEYPTTFLVLYFIGKLCACLCLNACWAYSSELYPTNLRAQALSTFSQASRVIGALAPFVSSLAYFWLPLPMLSLGLPALLACLLCQFQPDTKGQSLTEEVDDQRYALVSTFEA